MPSDKLSASFLCLVYENQHLGMKTYSLLISSLIILTTFSCETGTNCAQNQVCTEEFRTVSVKIIDQNQNPVELDSSYVTREVDSKTYRFPTDDWPLEGFYIVLTDLEMDEVDKKGSTFILSGFEGGQEVVHEEYVIGHDCCHIELLAGNTELTINL